MTLLHQLNIPRDVIREGYLVSLSQLVHIIGAKKDERIGENVRKR